MSRGAVRCALAPIALLVAGCVSGDERGSRLAASYSTDVRPILLRRCAPCHTSDLDLQAGLDFRTHASTLAGGTSGPVIVAGSPTRSLLVRMIVEEEMPPEGEKLTPAELRTVQRWIASGAAP